MSIAAAAIMGVVALVVGFILLLIVPGLQVPALGIIGFGVILLGAAFIIDFRTVRGALASKRGKFSTSTTILVCVFVGIILLVNSISVWKNHTFDFTGLSQFTLTTQTKDVLTKLDQTVDVLCFFTPTDDTGARDYAASLLKEYENYTDKLNIQIIDPEQNPETARKYGIVDSILFQSLIFKTDKGQRLVWSQDILSGAEHAMTSAILEVSGTTQRKVYFLSGHGEVDPNGTGDAGYAQAASSLKDNLFKVDTLDLLVNPKIPEDLAALVIGSPRQSLDDSEKQIIADYLKANGSVLFMIDPDSPLDMTQLLAPYGIDIQPGEIVEPKAYSAPSKATPLVDRTRNELQYTSLYFPGVIAITPQQTAPQELEYIPLVWSTTDAWIESDLSSLANPKFDEGADKKGQPWTMGLFIVPAAIPNSDQSAPTEYYQAPVIGVFGDSDFATNKNFLNGDNGELFVKTVGSLAGGKDVITIDRKVLQSRRLILSPEKARFLEISSIALLPAIVLLIGVAVWWQRRR